MNYVVTGGTGFIGRRVVTKILNTRPAARVWILVRRESLTRFEKLAVASGWDDRAIPLVGDLTEPDLGLTEETHAELGAGAGAGAGAGVGVDHLVHCGAIYDITAGDTEQRAANVEGTRAVIALPGLPPGGGGR